jgi:HPt (histidine-containing phosphotransfer) domain-containing protein
MSSTFDRARLVEQLGGEAIVDELLVMFTASIRQHLAELDAALERGDIPTAQRAVHNIKGISGSIYCRTLHQHASVVDQALKIGQIIDSDIDALRAAAVAFLDTISD